jgi:predicted DNA-binding protein
MNDMKVFPLRLSAQMRSRVRIEAAIRSTSSTELIREAIDKYLEPETDPYQDFSLDEITALREQAVRDKSPMILELMQAEDRRNQ